MPRSDQGPIRRLLSPPLFDDVEKTDTAWVLHWLFWSVAGLITLLILLLVPIVGENPARFLGQALAVDALCIGMLVVLRRGHVKLASVLLVAGMWSIAVFTVWTSDGLHSPATSTFLLAVAYTVLFFKRRSAVGSIVGASALFFGLAYLHTLGMIPEPAIAHTPWSRALTFTTYSVILAGALVLFMETLARSRQRTERELVVRRTAEDEVRALNADLEDRVQERTLALEEVVEELKEANARLAAATRAKSDFLAAMSHELRTPLNSVIGFSGILSSGMAGELNDEQQRQVGMIGESGRLLLDLVNKVLDLSKIESGDDSARFEEFDLSAAITRIVELMRPMAADKHLGLACWIEDDVGVVRSDRLRVEQALLNLVGNAVKFTESGSVAVAGSVRGSQAVIEVRDTGEGIPPEELSLVFDQFYQVRPESGSKHDGAGLGLPLARQLIQSVGGSISAESVPGEGSTFTIELPLTS